MSLILIIATFLGGFFSSYEAPVQAPVKVIQASVERPIEAPVAALTYDSPTLTTTPAPKPVAPVVQAPVEAPVEVAVQAPIKPLIQAPVAPAVAPVAPAVEAPVQAPVAPTALSDAEVWAYSTLKGAGFDRTANVTWLFTNTANCGAEISTVGAGGCTYTVGPGQYTVIMSPELAWTQNGTHILFHEFAHTQGIMDECAAESFAHQFEDPSDLIWSYPACSK